MPDTQKVEVKKVSMMQRPYKRRDEDADAEELKALEAANRGETKEPEVDPEAPEMAADPIDAEDKTFKKRYGDLRRHSQEKERLANATIADLKKEMAEVAKTSFTLPKTKEEVEEWTKEYPEVAAIIETIAATKSKEATADFDARAKQLETGNAELRRDRAMILLKQLQPDYDEIAALDEFHEWAEAQSKIIQDALYENVEDAGSISAVVDMWKSKTKWDDQKVDKKAILAKAAADTKAAASAVKTGGKGKPSDNAGTGTAFKESDVASMNGAEYERNHPAIQEAIQSGTFIYDISGAAR
jgi:hypothetical protein